MVKYTAVLLAVVAISGCSPAYVPPHAPMNHPANPKAEQVSYAKPHDALGMAPMQSAGGTPVHDEATKALLPEEASTYLRELLAAYVNIGDQLTTDATTDISEQAQRIGSVLDLLVQVDVPDSPHFWHELSEEIDAIQDQVDALAAPADLQSARAAYSVLSEAVARVVTSTGVPGGFDKPLQRFVCGMLEGAPHGGVWLQFGDAVRNPYFGTRMISCHRERALMPVRGNAGHPVEHTEDERGLGEHEHGGRG